MRICVLILFLFLFPVAGCVERYNPPRLEGVENFLVIDASLDGAKGTGTVVLRNSSPLHTELDTTFSTSATVTVTHENLTTYEFMSLGNGRYFKDNLNLNYSDKVRLDVTLSDGRSYQSDWVEYKKTPPIDSLTWEAKNNEISFYLYTHDPDKNSIYYKWDYEETWEFHTPYTQYFIRTGTEVMPNPDVNATTKCYNFYNSSNIILATTEKFQNDRIDKFRLATSDMRNNKFFVRYSILAKQRALTKTAYDYWKSLRLNTEGLGGLFDPQPYAIKSNIKNTSDPSGVVLGYFHVYDEKEMRIFIMPTELPPFDPITGYEYCEVDTVFLADLADVGIDVLIEELFLDDGTLIGYRKTKLFCADCRLRGSNVKPDYW